MQPRRARKTRANGAATVEPASLDFPGPAATTCGGAAFMPIEKVSLKADFEHWENETDTQLNRFNLGMAFEF